MRFWPLVSKATIASCHGFNQPLAETVSGQSGFVGVVNEMDSAGGAASSIMGRRMA